MNWEAVSAVAEWLGVILVVVSLGYVAFQIRQNTNTVRASTELETGRQWSEFHARIAHSEDMADIWDKGLTNAGDLTVGEKRKFIWLVAEYLFAGNAPRLHAPQCRADLSDRHDLLVEDETPDHELPRAYCTDIAWPG